MKSPDGFVQGYNAQVAVDALQLIVGQAVTQETNDKHQLVPMIVDHRPAIGRRHADAVARGRRLLLGRESGRDRGHRRSTPTSRRANSEHGECPGPCPRGPLPPTATRVDRMARKLLTKAGAAVYARRKAIVEPVIGQIKHARGFRTFLLRGPDEGASGMVAGVHDAQHL